MKTYTICGSMRYEKEMRKIAYFLESQKGYNILQCTYDDMDFKADGNTIKKLEEAHYQKIILSDGIYVVNIDGYIGGSVKEEIEFAKEHKKEILYHCN